MILKLKRKDTGVIRPITLHPDYAQHDVVETLDRAMLEGKVMSVYDANNEEHLLDTRLYQSMSLTQEYPCH